jgi:hypothetical protein
VRLIAIVLGACLALAVFKVAVQLLVAAIAVLVLTALVCRPKETVSCLGGLAMLGVIERYPLLAISGIIVLAWIGSIARPR